MALENFLQSQNWYAVPYIHRQSFDAFKICLNVLEGVKLFKNESCLFMCTTLTIAKDLIAFSPKPIINLVPYHYSENICIYIYLSGEIHQLHDIKIPLRLFYFFDKQARSQLVPYRASTAMVNYSDITMSQELAHNISQCELTRCRATRVRVAPGSKFTYNPVPESENDDSITQAYTLTNNYINYSNSHLSISYSKGYKYDLNEVWVGQDILWYVSKRKCKNVHHT